MAEFYPKDEMALRRLPIYELDNPAKTVSLRKCR